MMATICYDEIQSPIGPLVLCAEDGSLCNIEFGTFADTEPALMRWLRRWVGGGRLAPDRAVLREAAAQLEEYFAGKRRTFELSFKLYGTDFQRKVWQALASIPYGETRSYKQIGEAVGTPLAVRAVGGANHRNPVPIVIPCHRVIGANGTMVGYGPGLPIKKQLLELEGLTVRM